MKAFLFLITMIYLLNPTMSYCEDLTPAKKEAMKEFKKKMMEMRRKKRFPEEEEMGVEVRAESPEDLQEGLEMAQELVEPLEGENNDVLAEEEMDEMPEDLAGDEIVDEELEEPVMDYEEMLADITVEKIEEYLNRMRG